MVLNLRFGGRAARDPVTAVRKAGGVEDARTRAEPMATPMGSRRAKTHVEDGAAVARLLASGRTAAGTGRGERFPPHFSCSFVALVGAQAP